MKNLLRISALISMCLMLLNNYIFAQCPSSVGAFGSPVMNNGSCYINIQLAIPNSTVSIYNISGLVAQGLANNSGNATISYPCADNPITSIKSVITTPSLQICNEFTITPLQILPVNLSSFSILLNNQKKPVLSWTTVFEIIDEKIEVEKSSDDFSYRTIKTIECIDFFTGERKYTYEDLFFTGDSSAYYRLKLTEAGGKISYSKTLFLSNLKSTSVKVYPNPVDQGNSFSFAGISATEINTRNISITDLTGRNIPFIVAGANSFFLQPSVSPGIYFVRLNNRVLKLIQR